jgi:DNA repair photolyase
MSRKTIFVPYRPKTILNKGKRADHWFWTRYSAYPYLGCQHGCQFCCCRERKYSPYDEPADFAYMIKVKENAPQLLRQALSHNPTDFVFTGDYQPAERVFKLSRLMLEVCLELGFPVFVLERSPLVLRDLDLLKAIDQRSRAVVAFSVISTPDSPQYARVRQMENLAPAPGKRFAAMEQVAKAGILTGVCFMPILPGLCDDGENLRQVIRGTANHGGQFVLAGGLTLADQQRELYTNVLRERFPDLLPLYARLYPDGSYGPVRSDPQALARRIRELCQQHGIRDRIPRLIIPGDKRALNKQIVAELAEEIYTLEINAAPASQLWPLQKAAWAIEDLEQDIGLIYRSMGLKGLEAIPDIGVSLGRKIERKVNEGRPESAPGKVINLMHPDPDF